MAQITGRPRTRQAFTLIELLVVVTIIVVLLALLTPALERAIYSAELTACGAQMKGVGQGVTQYAMSNKRHYPYRPGVPLGWQPFQLTERSSPTLDERPYIMPYFSLKQLVDPLSGGELDLSPEGTDDDSAVIATIQLWYSWGYPGQRSSTKLGQAFSFTDDRTTPAKTHRYSLLASDCDSYDPTAWVYGSHPDRDGVMQWLELDDEGGIIPGLPVLKLVWSRWQAATPDRGLIDRNFAYQDGSVNRLTDLKTMLDGHPSMKELPIYSHKAEWPRFRTYVPSDD
jgi:prepilin-type N-terminal cleavage/methylation domain-containing protein